MFDSFDRRIDYLRVSVTDRCNLRCIYCMPGEGIRLKSHSDILSYEQISHIVRAAVPLGIHKIRLTGGEPLVRKNIAVLIRQLKAIPGLSEVAMTTNGSLLEAVAPELKQAGLDRLNISLDTLDAAKYRRLTRGGDIERVFAGIAAASAAGFAATKINMVLIPGGNDDEIEAMKEFCLQRGLRLQRIHHYSLHEGLPSHGALEAERPPPCRACNRLRLTADGKFKPCLFSERELAVDFADIAASIREAVRAKPPRGLACGNRGNWQIGG
ncbi:MAG: radical SAM protein [Candidatus Aminicenantes bacterium]|nr:radical SAM protein [Candidatus Aminicenantes bacterium]